MYLYKYDTPGKNKKIIETSVMGLPASRKAAQTTSIFKTCGFLKGFSQGVRNAKPEQGLSPQG